MPITISKASPSEQKEYSGLYCISFEYYYNDSKELYRSFHENLKNTVSMFERAESFLNKFGQYLLPEVQFCEPNKVREKESVLDDCVESKTGFEQESLTDDEIAEFRSLYNQWFLTGNPDVVLIRPMNEVATEFYTNHSTYHDGDSGLDLFCLEDQEITNDSPGKLKLGIQCQANGSFWLLPRSSISKTPLRMANSIGLIDKGYRGELMAVVDNITRSNQWGDTAYQVSKGDRLFQIAFPDLREIRPVLTDFLSSTSRGEGGFGSTN